MTMIRILSARAKVARAEDALSKAKAELANAVNAFLIARPEGVRELARKMKVSAPYVSDLLNGRRGLSDSMLEKLKELK